jgi:energy-coupling factor transporter ATP-binding protein EcfA2
MENKKKYHAFLSHNSQDKPIVETIARWLAHEAQLSVWLDKWNLIPGDPWQEEIEKALDQSQCCLVFLGPNGIGPWQNEEMRAAIEERVSSETIRVVPVLLPGAMRPQKESEIPRFLRRVTWVRFKEKWEDPQALHLLVCGIHGKIPGPDSSEIQEGICPFRGLEVFREQDRRFFFGRDVLVQRLLDKLAHSRFLAVAGPSGCGKSSLVHAGLIAPLKQHSVVVVFTPRERPLEELAFALRTGYPDNNKPPAEELMERLNKPCNILHIIAREMVEEAVDKKNLLIIIDQFEELFTQTANEEERSRFISLLLEAVEVVKGPVTVILTIRSDFIGKCAYYENLNMFVIDHLVQVEPMGFEELRQAIEEPARMVGLHFESGLINRILADVKGAPGELPLLEHALLELYEKRKGALLSSGAYDAIGGITGALVNRAESEFNKLDDEEKEILHKMFVLRMIQPGEGTEDTRRRALKEELLAIGGDAGKVERVLNRWIDARLLTGTQDRDRGQVMIDVAHEALIRQWDKIQTWMGEGREAARLTGALRQAALEWKRANCCLDFLFQGARLVQLEELVNSHAEDLTVDEIEFVQAGVKLREAKEREKEELREKELQAAQALAAVNYKAVKRARVIIALIVLSLITVIVLAFNFYISEKRARIGEYRARKQLAVNIWDNSRQAREKDQMLLAFHLCAEALNVNPDSVFRKTLLFDMNDLWNCFPLVHILRHKGPVQGAIFNVDETRILTWSRDGTVRIWDAQTGSPIGQPMVHDSWVSRITFNTDKTRILTWSRDGTVRIWDAQTGSLIGHDSWVSRITFNTDKTRILTWYHGGTARIWDAQTGSPIGQRMVHKKEIIGAKFNPEGTRIITWNYIETGIWDARKETEPLSDSQWYMKGYSH